jgi:hypothetical protein
MKLMNGQRVAEVHLLGADVEAAVEMVPITQIEMEPGADPRYSISWWGPPGVPPPQVGRNVRYFKSGSTGQDVVAECTRYFKLLESAVREFDPGFQYPAR